MGQKTKENKNKKQTYSLNSFYFFPLKLRRPFYERREGSPDEPELGVGGS